MTNSLDHPGSSQLYESAAADRAPMFHFGILVVTSRPGSRSPRVGTQGPPAWSGGRILAVQAVVLGWRSPASPPWPALPLIYRHPRAGKFMATTVVTTRWDVPRAGGGVIVAGLGGRCHPALSAYNYRETVMVWFRSVCTATSGDLMGRGSAGTPDPCAGSGWRCTALWPFTRLVHAH